MKVAYASGCAFIPDTPPRDPAPESSLRVVVAHSPKCGHCRGPNDTGTPFCSTWCRQEWRQIVGTFAEMD